MSLEMKVSRAQALGDPGIFGSIGKFLGGVAKTAVRAIPGVGPIAATGIELLAGGGPRATQVAAVSPSLTRQQVMRAKPMNAAQRRRAAGLTLADVRQYGGSLKKAIAARDAALTAEAGVKRGAYLQVDQGPPRGGRGTPIMAGPRGECPAGYHPNKTGYYAHSPLGTPTWVSPGERCVRRRRNPGNMRAADRAISRIEQSKRALQRLNRVTIRKTC